MKKNVITTIMLSVMTLGTAYSQTLTAEQLSSKVARKLQDSLTLNQTQYTQIYQASLQLHLQKVQIWKTYKGTDSLTKFLQRIENKRDDLYKPCIGNEAKFQQYLQKKHKLLSAD